jgi:hypothetical protein
MHVVEFFSSNGSLGLHSLINRELNPTVNGERKSDCRKSWDWILAFALRELSRPTIIKGHIITFACRSIDYESDWILTTSSIRDVLHLDRSPSHL